LDFVFRTLFLSALFFKFLPLVCGMSTQILTILRLRISREKPTRGHPKEPSDRMRTVKFLGVWKVKVWHSVIYWHLSNRSLIHSQHQTNTSETIKSLSLGKLYRRLFSLTSITNQKPRNHTLSIESIPWIGVR
jgi:hypothetical protein